MTHLAVVNILAAGGGDGPVWTVEEPFTLTHV